jgi:hypothetical protein
MPKDFDKPSKGCPVKVGRDLEAASVADMKHERRWHKFRRLGTQLDLQELLLLRFAGRGLANFGRREPPPPLVESCRRHA